MSDSTAANLQTVARALSEARRNQRPADGAALERLLAGPEDAYAVQDMMAQQGGWHAGPVARYWKSGGPSRTAALTHAPLPEEGVWPSPGDARGRHYNVRLIEAEVALRLGQDVTPAQAAALTHEDAPALVEAMAVSIELVDSRWQQGPKSAPALLKLADLQSHGALVLGEWQPFAARDWSQQVCRAQIGAAGPQQFQGTHSLGDPAWLLPIWLRHATRHGATVPRGTVVTTGTWCGMLTAQAGDRVDVQFDGIGSAALQL